LVLLVIQVAEKQKYDGIYQNLGPMGGKLPGDIVKPVMMNSKLPLDTLSKVLSLLNEAISLVCILNLF
jgi:epidermal growth factor receptor substrate 15